MKIYHPDCSMSPITCLHESIKKYPFLVNGPEDCYHLVNPSSNLTICLAAIIHGNETIGLYIMQKILEEIKTRPTKYKVSFKIVIANPKAFLRNKRFIETDLNRCFGTSIGNTYEENRAREIHEFIKGSDALIDFHQTIEPTNSAFLIFNNTEKNLKFAEAISPRLPLIAFSNSKLTGGLSSAPNTKDMGSVTLELGEKGFDPKQVELGVKIVENAIQYLNSERREQHTESQLYTWGETILNPDRSLELKAGLMNFSSVKASEVIGRNIRTGQELKSNIDGIILFPKYGENALHSNELVRILKKITKKDLYSL